MLMHIDAYVKRHSVCIIYYTYVCTYQVFPHWASAAPSTGARPVHAAGGERETPSVLQAQWPSPQELEDLQETYKKEGRDFKAFTKIHIENQY